MSDYPACHFCKAGQVVTKIRREPASPSDPRRIGGRNGVREVPYYYCNSCGLSYQFLPPKVVVAPVIQEGMIQTEPGVMERLDSGSIFAQDVPVGGVVRGHRR